MILALHSSLWMRFSYSFMIVPAMDLAAQLPLIPSSAAISQNFFFRTYRAWSHRARPNGLSTHGKGFGQTAWLSSQNSWRVAASSYMPPVGHKKWRL
jgi:hypothetical protein